MRDSTHSKLMRNASSLLPFRKKPSKSQPQGLLIQCERTLSDQSESAFFTNLPPEIRSLIYLEAIRGDVDAVHVVKETKKKTKYVRCRGKCWMPYNYKCCDGTEPRTDGGLSPFLRTCRQAHLEAKDVLYTCNAFDFRSFDFFIILSLTALPQTWKAIRKIRLKWHFGYRLWCGHEDERSTDDPVWVKVWDIMASMKDLGDIQVDLDAYLETQTLDAEVEAEVFRPLSHVRQAPYFVVSVTWFVGSGGIGVGNVPFRLVRVVDGQQMDKRDIDRTRIKGHSNLATEPRQLHDFAIAI